MANYRNTNVCFPASIIILSIVPTSYHNHPDTKYKSIPDNVSNFLSCARFAFAFTLIIPYFETLIFLLINSKQIKNKVK